MSESKNNDLLPLLVMLESIGKIQLYAAGFSDANSFFMADDQVKFNASLMLLSNVGEYCGKISERLKSEYPKISWKQIRGLRNRISHDYTGIDYEMVFEIITQNLPKLKTNFETIIAKELATGFFAQEECEIAKQSIFYRHIDFNAFRG
jgi:uncharacterized protein with HEPN domain